MSLKLSTKAAKIVQNFGSMKELEDVMCELLKSVPDAQIRMDDFFQYMTEGQGVIEKNVEQSTRQRHEGNRLYINSKTSRDYLEVLRMYNECISFAPNKSEELALAYGNRAMILFRLNYFNECLADINRALCLNYPDKSVAKLLVKRVRCMKILKHPDLLVIYEDCLRWVEENPNKFKFKIKEEIKTAFEEAVPEGLSQRVTQFQDDLLEEMKKSCPDLKKVQIGKNSRGEMTLVAATDIEVGETVAVEKIYAHVFHMERAYLTCWQCLMMCLNPIPCEGCTGATYCSESCKAEAWSKHHEVECQMMPMINVLLGDCMIPVNICMVGMKQCGGILPLMKEVYKMCKIEDIQKEYCIKNGVYPSDSYRSIYFMLMNKYPIAKKDYSEDVVRIGWLVYYLATRTTIFGQKYNGSLNTVLQERLPKFFASLILRHFIILENAPKRAIILPNNVHADVTAVGPLFHIMNHSCNPNTTKFSLKNYQILVAVDHIKKGQALTFSYFERVLIKLPKYKRNNLLKDILLRPCTCEVCSKNLSHELSVASDLVNNSSTMTELGIFLERIKTTAFRYKGSKATISASSAPEFLQRTAEIFNVFKPFFATAPPICQEIIHFKNYLLETYYQLHNTFYNFLDD